MYQTVISTELRAKTLSKGTWVEMQGFSVDVVLPAARTADGNLGCGGMRDPTNASLKTFETSTNVGQNSTLD
jgi:hypothetical protein